MPKYIDVKLKHVPISSIKDRKNDTIFCYHSFDTLYDHKSEDLGHFYDVAFEEDGQIFWETTNTGDFIPEIDEPYLEKIENDSLFDMYINKNKKKDIKVEVDNDGYWVITYQNKYRFSYNPRDNY